MRELYASSIICSQCTSISLSPAAPSLLCSCFYYFVFQNIWSKYIDPNALYVEFLSLANFLSSIGSYICPPSWSSCYRFFLVLLMMYHLKKILRLQLVFHIQSLNSTCIDFIPHLLLHGRVRIEIKTPLTLISFFIWSYNLYTIEYEE